MGRNLSFLKGSRGFTLVELLVTIGITIVLIALVVPSWKAGSGTLALDRAAVKLSQDIKRALEFSLSTRSHTCATGSISGYGIFLNDANEKEYLIFADCNGNYMYDYGQGIDDDIEIIPLGIESQILTVSEGYISIMFVPPDPTVFIRDFLGRDFTSANVVLSLRNDVSTNKTLTINAKGVVSIQ